MRVYSIQPQWIDDLYKSFVKNVPDLRDHFSEPELRREISNFLSRLLAFPPGPDFEDIVNNFVDSLRQEKEYEAIILLKGLIELPLGTV